LLKRLLKMLFALMCGALVLAPAAGATTGIEVTVPVKVAITEGGVVFTPAATRLHPDTDTTYQVRVVNRTSARRAFQLGYRKTRLLAKGASEDFYFTFHAVGKIRWSAGDVKTPRASGTFDVKLAKGFSGG
jgi:hypothetical protein